MSVELSNTRKDLSGLAKELDIPSSLLYRWRREYAGKQNNSFPGNGKVSLTAAEQELAELKKELRETQMERDILKKGCQYFLQERWRIFGFIKNHSRIFPIGKMCFVFKVSRAGYYGWLRSTPSKRLKESQIIEQQIQEAFTDSERLYGSFLCLKNNKHQ